MKSIYKLTFLVSISILVLSCKDNLKPNYQYMPNMYEHVGYATYSQAAVFKGGVEAQLPAEGTIKRGFDVYGYANSVEGYDSAKLNSISPLDSLSSKDVEKSKYLFEIYCGICHGNEGNGNAATCAPATVFHFCCSSCKISFELRARSSQGLNNIPPKPKLTVGTPVI